MKKMLVSLIVISILGTGTVLAQRRSSNNAQGGHRDAVRTETSRNYGGGHHSTHAREYNDGNRGPVTHVVHHGPAVHHAPVVHHHHPMPVHHRPHVYRERVVVAPAPVVYSSPCPPPPPAPVVVVEPAHPAISIGALAGALIGGTIAAAACR